MSQQNTDVMIYTKSVLTPEQFEVISNEVKDIKGVTRFERVEKRPYLIMVAYQATQTKALAILNKITRMGFNASLVGI